MIVSVRPFEIVFPLLQLVFFRRRRFPGGLLVFEVSTGELLVYELRRSCKALLTSPGEGAR